jgi:hypothetical protein
LTKYQIDYSYQVPEWGTIDLPADNEEQAREFALEQIKELYPEILEIQIDKVRVVN